MALKNNKNRWPIYIAAAASLLIMFGIAVQSKDHLPASAKQYWPFTDPGQQQSQAGSPETHTEPVQAQPEVALLPPIQQNAASFYEIAIKFGTDKVTDHSYQDMYEKYLPALRYQKIKMLEIGLGCDMYYGPGASYHLWLEYFPNVELYFLEYDAECAAQWADKTTGATIITGDQADPVVLENIVATYGSDFDLIIDDGGHTMVQQQTSLQHLWKAVKPGGVYFCEDLQTSYWDRFGGGATAAQAGATTMMQYIHQMIEDLTWGARRIQFPDVETIVHIDCSRELCGFFKKSPV